MEDEAVDASPDERDAQREVGRARQQPDDDRDQDHDDRPSDERGGSDRGGAAHPQMLNRHGYWCAGGLVGGLLGTSPIAGPPTGDARHGEPRIFREIVVAAEVEVAYGRDSPTR